MHPKHRGVALLLSLGSLPIGLAACNKDDDANTHIGTQGPVTSDGDSDDAPTTSTGEVGTSGTSGPANTDTTVEPTTAGPTTAGPTTAGPTTADPTTAGPTTADPTTGQSSDPTTGAPADTCTLYGEQLAMCPGYDAATETQNCRDSLDTVERADGQVCRDKFEAFYACESEQPCEKIPSHEGCVTEFFDAAKACPNSTG